MSHQVLKAPTEQRPALPLGHTTPDTELDSVVERIRKALRANRASPADQLGAILRCSLDEQLVRVGSLACGRRSSAQCSGCHSTSTAWAAQQRGVHTTQVF